MMRPWRVQYSSDGQSFIEETPDNVDDEGRLVAHLFDLDEPGRDRRLADLIVSAVNARLVVGADVAKLRALLAAAVLDARRLPLTVVLEDGANPDGGYSWHLGDCRGAFVCGSMSRTEAEAIAAAVNQAIPLLDELEALRAERDRLKDIVSATSCSLELALARVQEYGAKLDAWRIATGCDTPEEMDAERVAALALAEARDEGHAAGRAEALEALDRMRSTVTSWLAALAGMDRVPCRHYRECGCREVLDRERVMRMIVDLRDAPGFRGLAGKL